MVTESIKKGYKQTEIGVIPKDWEKTPWGDIFDFLSTATYSREQLTENQEVLYVHYGDIHTKLNHFLDFQTISLPTINKKMTKNYSLIKDGDLIMADASEDYEGVGKSVEVKNIKDNKAISGLHTFLMRDKRGVFVNGFKGYISRNKFVKNQFDKLATGLKVYGVSKNNLKSVLIPYPKDLQEQSAIALVLSNTDALIEQLDKLIAKKKNIKQGTMQELLTGKRRLPRFKGKWEEKKVKQFGEVITGSTPSTLIKDYWNGEIPWVTPTDITEKKNISKTEREITSLGLKVIRKLPANTLLITCIASIGKNAILKKDGACNQQINAIVPNYQNDVDFLYYLMENNKNYLLGNAGITATNIISKKDFSEILFTVPPTIEEQSAIAKVLSDMDAEIGELERKRDKYLKLKAGMMQQLLTGRIRLKWNN